MKLLIIFGPQAVGKMTVGHELEKLTELKLFHNHMTIELVNPFFNYGTPKGKEIVQLFRKTIFEEVAKSDLEGLIFTFVWAFDQQSDWDYINNLCNIFESQNATIYFVELEANVDERLKRNTHPHRLSHKPSKKNIEFSENDLKDSMIKYRLNSNEGEIKQKNYIKINNTNLSPEKTAALIKEKFNF